MRKPDWIERGLEHYQKCAFDKAEKAFRQAIKHKPTEPHGHINLALVLLLNGQYEDGFEAFDWRLKIEPWASFLNNIPVPQWSGEKLQGKTIMLYTEQGAGDAIQSVRFAKDLAARGAKVLVATQPHLKALFEHVDGISQVLAEGDHAQFDFIAPLFSMPKHLSLPADAIPHCNAYIKTPKLGGSLIKELESDERPKIGIAWAGNPKHLNDRNRSIPLSKFRSVLDGVNAQVYSFQLPLSPADKSTLEATGARDLSPHLKSYLHTATIMAEMDLMICVDTSVAHLAGALGKKTWTLIPFAPDWRWMLERTDTPWYPTMQLFRQPKPKDWVTPISQLNTQLKGFVEQLGF